MSDKKKRWLVIAGLTVVCIGLVFGISRMLYHEPQQEIQMVDVEPKDMGTVIDAEIPEESYEPAETAEPEADLVIETDLDTAVNESEQEIQKDPVKTEDTKPTEPPALVEGSDTGDPEKPPVYEDPKEDNRNSQPDNTKPSNGEIKDGMIYVEGFGWVPYEGGGSSGTTADDMYENGNKIGSMD